MSKYTYIANDQASMQLLASILKSHGIQSTKTAFHDGDAKDSYFYLKFDSIEDTVEAVKILSTINRLISPDAKAWNQPRTLSFDGNIEASYDELCKKVPEYLMERHYRNCTVSRDGENYPANLCVTPNNSLDTDKLAPLLQSVQAASDQLLDTKKAIEQLKQHPAVKDIVIDNGYHGDSCKVFIQLKQRPDLDSAYLSYKTQNRHEDKKSGELMIDAAKSNVEQYLRGGYKRNAQNNDFPADDVGVYQNSAEGPGIVIQRIASLSGEGIRQGLRNALDGYQKTLDGITEANSNKGYAAMAEEGRAHGQIAEQAPERALEESKPAALAVLAAGYGDAFTQRETVKKKAPVAAKR